MGLTPARAARHRRVLAALGLALAACGALHAQPAVAPKDGDFLDLLAGENQVFSAARYVQTMAETPANVTVLGGDELRRHGYRTVREALAALPGVYDASSQWPALGVSGVAIPGDFGSRVLYLVNGMPIYEPTYGGFFLEYLDLESIERIEFVKGAGSALYGSGAVLALVNLITRNGQDGAGLHAAAGVASHASARVYASYGQADGHSDSFASASVGRSAGRDLYLREFDSGATGARFGGISAGNDGGHDLRLFARRSYEHLWLQGLYVGGSKRDPLASYGSVLNGRLQLREALTALEAGWNRDLGDSAQLTARAYLFRTSERGDYPYTNSGARVPPTDYINVSDLSSQQQGVELRYDRFFADGHHLLAGAEAKRIGYAHQVGDQPGPVRAGVLTVDTRAHYTQWSVFAQDEMRLGPGRLFLGLRYDRYDGLSDGVRGRVSPRVAYLQDLAPATNLKLIVGEAYRAPTIYESGYQDGLPAASTIWANPRLRPELARSLEALLTHESRPGLQWRLSAFLKRLTDSPVQVPTALYQGVACALEGCIQYRNSGLTQTVRGIEADVRLKQADRGSAYASLVLQNGRQDGVALASSPRTQFKAGLSRNLPWRDASAALEAHYIGSVHGLAEPDAGAGAPLPAYTRVNAALRLGQPGAAWSASLRIDNLFDQAYSTVASRELQPLRQVPAEGRRLSLQLELAFK